VSSAQAGFFPVTSAQTGYWLTAAAWSSLPRKPANFACFYIDSAGKVLPLIAAAAYCSILCSGSSTPSASAGSKSFDPMQPALFSWLSSIRRACLAYAGHRLY
jgi:hypothetical protein